MFVFVVAIKDLQLRKESKYLVAVVLHFSDSVFAQVQCFKLFKVAKSLEIIDALNFVVCELQNFQSLAVFLQVN